MARSVSRKTRESTVKTAVCLASFLIAMGSVLAASSSNHPVLIDGPSRRASGTVASTDSLEPIGCHVYRALWLRAAECDARDAAGATAKCTTREPDLIAAAAAAARQDAYLSFMWNDQGYCTSIQVSDPPQARR
jgi:hypothetical protein